MAHAPTELGAAGRPHGRSAFSTAVSTILTVLGEAIILWSNRRAVQRLAALDDRHLTDIGLSRADIHWALSQPWRVDPSLALSKRVASRRAAARWAKRFR